MKCRETSSQKIFSFRENRSLLTLDNTNGVVSTKIHVDGCEIDDDGIRCDYLHTTNDLEIYIELKGQDIEHAIKQIERTITLLSLDKIRQLKRSYIICTRSPMSSTGIQHFDRIFRKKYNSKLIVKSSPFRDSY